MFMNEKYYFKDKNGNMLEFNSQIVCFFETEDDMKYMVYTNNLKNDLGKLIVYGATVGNDNVLTPVPKEEYYLIEDSISLLKQKYGTQDLRGAN